MKLVLASVAVALLATTALGGFVVTAPGPYDSNGPVNDAANGVFTYAYGGPEYWPGNMTFEGDLTAVNTGTYMSEARIAIKDPSGHQNTCQPFTDASTWTGTIHAGPMTFIGPGAWSRPTVGNWEFRFYESYDDGGTASVDARWTNLNFGMLDGSEPDPLEETFYIGTLATDPTYFTYTEALSAGGRDYYHFRLPGDVNDANGRYLNIQTLVSSTGVTMDTEIAIVDAAGIIVATDDDGQITDNGGLFSMLSHGIADPYFNTDTAAGVDGPIAAGEYTLVVAGYDTAFTIGQPLSGVTWGTATGSYDLVIHYTPEPAALALLALGMMLRRR